MGSELSSSVSSGPVECHPGAEMNAAPALLSRDLAAITGIARKSMDRTIACEDEPPRQRLKRNSCVASSSSEPIFQHSVGPWKSASKLQPPTLSTRELEFDGEATIRLIHGDPDARVYFAIDDGEERCYNGDILQARAGEFCVKALHFDVPGTFQLRAYARKSDPLSSSVLVSSVARWDLKIIDKPNVYRIPKNIIRATLSLLGVHRKDVEDNQAAFEDAIMRGSQRIRGRCQIVASRDMTPQPVFRFMGRKSRKPIGTEIDLVIDVYEDSEGDVEFELVRLLRSKETMDLFASCIGAQTLRQVDVSQPSVERLDSLKLRLSWDFADRNGMDFLDGTCFVFADGGEHVMTSDFRNMALIDSYYETRVGHGALQHVTPAGLRELAGSQPLCPTLAQRLNAQAQRAQAKSGTALPTFGRVGDHVIVLDPNNPSQYASGILLAEDDGHFAVHTQLVESARPGESEDPVERILLTDRHHISLLRTAIEHSGDELVSHGGRQEISIHLERLPTSITSMVFVLSAFESADLSMIPSPAVGLYSAMDSDRSLTTVAMEDAGSKSAFIICSMTRKRNGSWQMQSICQSCDGNARDYFPIKRACSRLVV